MRQVMLLGAANGHVIDWKPSELGDALPKLLYVLGIKDEETGKYLTTLYRLYAFDSKEAYYVPEAFSDLQVVKGLIQQQ